MKINFKIDRNNFFENFYEKNFFIQKSVLNGGFSWKDLNDLLYCMDARESNIKLYNNGPVNEVEYIYTSSEFGASKKKIVKSKLYDQMKNGATLVLNKANWKSPSIQELCNEVSRFANGQSVANGYLAFCGDGTFGNHWDTHDVFAVQLIGRKRWKIYKPTFELPISNQTSLNHKSACPSEPVFDGYLEEGDVLYIPRGWWHNALPQNEPTFHVAIGLHAPKVVDYLAWFSSKILPGYLEGRKSVASDKNGFNNICQSADLIKELLSKREIYDEFINQLIAAESWNSTFQIEKFGTSNIPDEQPPKSFKINSSYFSINDESATHINGIDIQPYKNTLLSVAHDEQPADEEILLALSEKDILTAQF